MPQVQQLDSNGTATTWETGHQQRLWKDFELPLKDALHYADGHSYEVALDPARPGGFMVLSPLDLKKMMEGDPSWVSSVDGLTAVDRGEGGLLWGGEGSYADPRHRTAPDGVAAQRTAATLRASDAAAQRRPWGFHPDCRTHWCAVPTEPGNVLVVFFQTPIYE
ncbi:hypothetical protein ABZ348_15085 [Streptomyces sp. NPDC005963]|uniref:hypothetical protein n=1 Tax=Streptomyces sp. NPDC005963 TaxID=3156721 RepID=UPI0033FC986C